jgi:YbbR domain-containing protein
MRKHLGLKLLSVLLGFSLWYAIAREQEAEFSLSIPVELRDVPEGLEVIEESVRTVEVRLRGTADILRRLTPQDLHVGIDLQGAKPGERFAYLGPGDVAAPFGVRVTRVTPANVRLRLDTTMERLVEVIPRVVGSPAEGYEIHRIDLSPAEITVTGPTSRLDGLEQVTSEPVSADGLREPYSRMVRVELDPLLRTAGDPEVTLTLDIREERLRRDLSGVPVKGLPDDRVVKLSPEHVKVRIEGPMSTVEEMRAEDLEARLSLTELSPGRHEVTPEVVLSSTGDLGDLSILSVVPERIRVQIQ